MSDEIPKPPTEDESELFPLSYASPRLVRRHANGPMWKAVVRVVGGMMAAMFLVGYVARMFSIPGEAWRAILLGVGLAALIGLIAWERGMVLKDPIWEGAKDLRAQTYRASASRFDSSGVTILDPQAGGGGMTKAEIRNPNE